MSEIRGSVKRSADAEFLLSSAKRVNISREIKRIESAIQLIEEKAHRDGLKKKEEAISSVAVEIRSMFDELKTKIEKDRQKFAKALSKRSKECENALKEETVKFEANYDKFSKEIKMTHLQALKDTFSKYEEEEERLFKRYEQLRKKERNMLQEKEKICAERIAELEDSLKKKKWDEVTFSYLRENLGTFLDQMTTFPDD